MSNLFYRNLRLLILTIILIFVWGLSSYQLLPRLEDPELTPRNAVVTTHFPGANAERVESLVTDKLERELQEVEEIQTIDSTSQTGLSVITLELFDRIKEVEPIWSRVRDKLDDAVVQLPADATEPEFDELKAKAYALIAAISWKQDDRPNYAILRRRAEALEDQLRGLGGTEEIDLFGDPDEEIVVEIKPSDLATLGLTVPELSQQIQASDAKISAGQFRSSQNDLLIEVEGELDSLERIRKIPISFGNGGQFARLGDIALVNKGIVEPPSDIAIINNHPGIAIAASVKSSEQLNRWATSAHQIIDEFRENLPRGLELQTIFDQSLYVNKRLDKLTVNLLLGATLVFGVTFLIMGWQSALVVGVSLPLSSLITLAGMRSLGVPLHQMSITGLIVALGLLIDNAIVAVDEVQNNLKQGIKPTAAIRKTVRYLSVPLLASTLTTIMAFIPIAAQPGAAGEFVGPIAISVILAVVSSLFLALTIIPALTAKLYVLNKKRGTRNETESRSLFRTWWSNGFSHPQLTRLYDWSLKQTISQPILGVTLALLLPVIGFVQFPTLEEQFFPAADRDQFHIELEMPSSTALKQTRAIATSIREIVLRHSNIVNLHWFAGESGPKFYYNLLEGRESEANYAQALVQATSASAARDLIPRLQLELDSAVPSGQVLVRQLEQGPPFDAPIEMRIYGSDLNQLRELGKQARAELSKVANVTHIRDNLTEVLPKLGLRLDEEAVQLAGLDNITVAEQLQTTLEGRVGGSILEATEQLPVRVRLSTAGRGELDRIASLNLLPSSQSLSSETSNSMELIPLSAVGDIELVPELAEISRRNGQRVNTVQGFIVAGTLPSKVLADFKQQLEGSDFQLPPGYWYEFGGEAEERDEAVGDLMSLVGVLAVLMIASLVLSLGSFRLAGIIGVVGICSIGLGLFSLWLFGYPFGFMAVIGTIGLVGVAINDSIVVLTALKEDPMACKGNRKAVREVVLHSTRHVIATTLTTIIGFVPLLLGGGGFWPPLAVAIAGGIGGATLLALYLVPSAYLILKGDS